MRLFDLVDAQLKDFPLSSFLNYKNQSGVKEVYSTSDVVELSKKCSIGLLDIGLEKGDKVGIMTDANRPEWVIIDIAIQRLGLISVPLYASSSPSELVHIAQESSMKMCFVSTEKLSNYVHELYKNLDGYTQTYVFDPSDRFPSWTDLLSDSIDEERIEKYSSEVKSNELCTLIYTSGTTGLPKGVMLTHDNILYNVKYVREMIPLNRGDVVLSFLPISHVFERVAVYVYVEMCLEVHFVPIDDLGGDAGALKRVKPHFFTAVPRLLEKVFDKIEAKGYEAGGLKNAILQWSIRLTRTYEYDQKPSFFTGLKMKIADKLVFGKWRDALGGNIKGIVVAAAACPPPILRAFNAAGVPLREGYGLTEAAPGISFNQFTPGMARIGTTGIVLTGSNVILDNDEGIFPENEGEICFSGPGVMLGYFKQKEKTDEVLFEKDGVTWLRTGDVGKYVKGENGVSFLKITDRKKELLKTSGGKYVAPAHIEGLLRESFLIDQAMVVGDGKKFVSALIVPSFDGLVKWGEEKGLNLKTMEEFVNNQVVIDRIEAIVERINNQLPQVSKLKKFKLVAAPWQPEKTDGSEPELTPTLKLKRRVVLSKYGGLVKEMYDE